MWVSLAGALLGGTLAWLGARAARRWTSRPPHTWGVAACALAGALTGLALGRLARGFDPGFVRMVLLSAVVLTAALTDLQERIIPNELLLAASALWLLLQLPAPAGEWLSALAGGAFGAGLFLVLTLLFGEGAGMGDMKMAGVIGLYLGWPGSAVALTLAFLVGGLVSLVLLATGRATRRDTIAFGPCLAAGALAVMLWAPAAAGFLDRWLP